jgi:hypothetical protein
MTVQWSGAVRNARLDSWEYGAITAQGSATNWAQSTSYTANISRVQNGGNLYLCTGTGTSATSGSGPSGTGNSISDGSCTWDCINTTIWAINTAYIAYESWVIANGNVYLCITSGTSASSGGGPASVGNIIVDGTAHWTYIGEAAIGPSAQLRIYTGSQPSSCSASESGTLLVTFNLASDYAGLGSGGVKALTNLPLAATAGNAGTAAHYRIYDSTGTTCHEQGTVTITGGGGDATIDNTSITNTQTISLTGFSVTEAGA